MSCILGLVPPSTFNYLFVIRGTVLETEDILTFSCMCICIYI